MCILFFTIVIFIFLIKEKINVTIVNKVKLKILILQDIIFDAPIK